MFFNLGEEIRERAPGPWASAWRVEGFLASGRHFRHYLVRSLIPELSQQRAVLKVVKYDPRLCSDHQYVKALRARLRLECETLAHFSPRLPEPVDYFEIRNGQDPFDGFGSEILRDDEPLLVRSHIHGASLASLMEERGAPPANAEMLLLSLARVSSFLDELHASGRGWLFWELTPEHVIVDPEHDLEPAFVGSSNFRMLSKGMAVLPPRVAAEAMLRPGAGYAAPEVLCGAPCGPAADIYALGALVFHLFSGVDPRDLADDIAARHGRSKLGRVGSGRWSAPTDMGLEEAPAFCEQLRDSIERFCRRNLKGLGIHRARVRRLLLRAMDPDPSMRFASALEVRDEILHTLVRSMPVAWPSA